MRLSKALLATPASLRIKQVNPNTWDDPPQRIDVDFMVRGVNRKHGFHGHSPLWVYLARRSHDDSATKIGVTTRLSVRMRELTVECGVRVRLVTAALMPTEADARHLERLFLLANEAVSGEWVRLRPRDSAGILDTIISSSGIDPLHTL